LNAAPAEKYFRGRIFSRKINLHGTEIFSCICAVFLGHCGMAKKKPAKKKAKKKKK